VFCSIASSSNVSVWNVTLPSSDLACCVDFERLGLLHRLQVMCLLCHLRVRCNDSLEFVKPPAFAGDLLFGYLLAQVLNIFSGVCGASFLDPFISDSCNAFPLFLSDVFEPLAFFGGVFLTRETWCPFFIRGL
jgi:hypothetical protein